MKDNDLIRLLISTIRLQESIVDLGGISLTQAFQPEQQGTPSGVSAYLHKIGDRRIGQVLREDIWSELDQVMTHRETQTYETTFQFSALSKQNPSNVNQATASDILNGIAYILQSQKTIETLTAQDVGILKIGDIRNPYFLDDSKQNEASPNFDVVLVHKQIVSYTGNVIHSTEIQILTV